MNWIIDLLIPALAVAAIIPAYKKGFVRSALSLVYLLLSFIIAVFVSRLCANFLFDLFAKPWLTSTVEQEIVVSTGTSILEAVNNMYAVLPGILSGALGLVFGTKEEVVSVLTQSVADGSTTVATAIVELFRPIIVAMMSIIIAIILIFLLKLVFKLLDRSLRWVHGVPVIGSIDGFLGAMMGFLKSIIWIAIFVLVIKAVIVFTNNSNDFVNTRIVDSTFLFKHLYGLNLTQVFDGIL